MSRRYVNIQPRHSDGEAPSYAENSDGQPPGRELKKRQVIAVACDRCRRRKIRCDGNRPSCSSCSGISSQCTYRDHPNLSRETRRLIVEVVDILAHLPDGGAAEVLGRLRGESDAAAIMARLREKITPETDAALGSARSHLPLTELHTQNPNAYPTLSLDEIKGAIEDTTSQMAELSGNTTPWSTRDSQSESSEQQRPRSLCDSRLGSLDMRNWTRVPINNEIAAQAISLYLETDHPLLGFFEPDSFVASLTNPDSANCSPVLVCALLYWATQMYGAVDDRLGSFPIQFCHEAEELWRTEQKNDSILNVAAAQLLSLGYLGQGRDHYILQYLSQASSMANRLGLFGQAHDIDMAGEPNLAPVAPGGTVQHLYAAWGAFNWITHMSIFYRQPGSPYPSGPPRLPIPDSHEESGQERINSPDIAVLHPQSTSYMGGAFPYLCRFWRIMHDVSLAYNKQGIASGLVEDPRAFRFAEFKFRELLAWSGKLPSHLTRTDGTGHCTQVLHIWLHMAILEVFRPGMLTSSRASRLKTFAGAENTPEAMCNASINQLKQLIVNFRLNYPASSYSLLWHTALIYLANSILFEPKGEDWFFYFLLCVYGYKKLGRSWRVTEAISRALLSMALRNGDISSVTALELLQDLGQRPFDEGAGEIRATFMADLDMAQSNPAAATVEKQAAEFEQNNML